MIRACVIKSNDLYNAYDLNSTLITERVMSSDIYIINKQINSVMLGEEQVNE